MRLLEPCLWIMPDGGDNGKVYVDAVVVHSSFPTGFFGALAPSELWDDKDRYVLRIKVRK